MNAGQLFVQMPVTVAAATMPATPVTAAVAPSGEQIGSTFADILQGVVPQGSTVAVLRAAALSAVAVATPAPDMAAGITVAAEVLANNGVAGLQPAGRNASGSSEVSLPETAGAKEQAEMPERMQVDDTSLPQNVALSSAAAQMVSAPQQPVGRMPEKSENVSAHFAESVEAAQTVPLTLPSGTLEPAPGIAPAQNRPAMPTQNLSPRQELPGAVKPSMPQSVSVAMTAEPSAHPSVQAPDTGVTVSQPPRAAGVADGHVQRQAEQFSGPAEVSRKAAPQAGPPVVPASPDRVSVMNDGNRAETAVRAVGSAVDIPAASPAPAGDRLVQPATLAVSVQATEEPIEQKVVTGQAASFPKAVSTDSAPALPQPQSAVQDEQVIARSDGKVVFDTPREAVAAAPQAAKSKAAEAQPVATAPTVRVVGQSERAVRNDRMGAFATRPVPVVSVMASPLQEMIPAEAEAPVISVSTAVPVEPVRQTDVVPSQRDSVTPANAGTTPRSAGFPAPSPERAQVQQRPVMSVGQETIVSRQPVSDAAAPTPEGQVGTDTAAVASNAVRSTFPEQEAGETPTGAVRVAPSAAQPVTSQPAAQAVATLVQKDTGLDFPIGGMAKPLLSGGRGAAQDQTGAFHFSRSVAVEAAIGTAPQNGQNVEKTAVVSAGSSKIVAMHLPGMFATASADSDSGSAGSESSEARHQAAEMPTSVGLQPAGERQKAAEPVAASTAVAASDVSHPSHETVAGLVRERLGAHDVKPGSEQLVLKLSPEHLGDIKVNLRLEAQRLNVEIVAENRVARENLLQHVDTLKEALSRQNIRMESFDVTSGNSGFGSQGSASQGEWRELAKNRQYQQWLTGGYQGAPAAAPAPVQYLARAEHAMLDLHF